MLLLFLLDESKYVREVAEEEEEEKVLLVRNKEKEKEWDASRLFFVVVFVCRVVSS